MSDIKRNYFCFGVDIVSVWRRTLIFIVADCLRLLILFVPTEKMIAPFCYSFYAVKIRFT